MVPGIIEQKCIVTVRRINLGIGDLTFIAEQSLNDFPATIWRKAPIG
jgi:hypothetical protein